MKPLFTELEELDLPREVLHQIHFYSFRSLWLEVVLVDMLFLHHLLVDAPRAAEESRHIVLKHFQRFVHLFENSDLKRKENEKLFGCNIFGLFFACVWLPEIFIIYSTVLFVDNKCVLQNLSLKSGHIMGRRVRIVVINRKGDFFCEKQRSTLWVFVEYSNRDFHTVVKFSCGPSYYVYMWRDLIYDFNQHSAKYYYLGISRVNNSQRIGMFDFIYPNC